MGASKNPFIGMSGIGMSGEEELFEETQAYSAVRADSEKRSDDANRPRKEVLRDALMQQSITGGTPLQQKALAAVCALSPHQNFSVDYTAPLLTLHGASTLTLNTPVRLQALLASLATVTTASTPPATRISLGNSQLDLQTRTLHAPLLSPLELTEKECAILCSLQHAFPAAVSRDALLEKVWQYHASTTTHTVETHLYRLRQKLENHGVTDFLIVTEAEGYKMAHSI
jgi:hypothetical protein